MKQYLKISQNVAFEFWHFPPIFCLIKIDLSGSTVLQQVSAFPNLAKMDHFWHFWFTFVHSKCKHSSLNVEWDFLGHFQSLRHTANNCAPFRVPLGIWEETNITPRTFCQPLHKLRDYRKMASLRVELALFFLSFKTTKAWRKL